MGCSAAPGSRRRRRRRAAGRPGGPRARGASSTSKVRVPTAEDSAARGRPRGPEIRTTDALTESYAQASAELGFLVSELREARDLLRVRLDEVRHALELATEAPGQAEVEARLQAILKVLVKAAGASGATLLLFTGDVGPGAGAASSRGRPPLPHHLGSGPRRGGEGAHRAAARGGLQLAAAGPGPVPGRAVLRGRGPRAAALRRAPPRARPAVLRPLRGAASARTRSCTSASSPACSRARSRPRRRARPPRPASGSRCSRGRRRPRSPRC